MKKIAAIVLSALIAAAGIVSASATPSLADGTYAVNLSLMHAEKDQTSMGNRYVGQRGLLKVSGGSYQIYIVPADGYDDQFEQVDFKYYQDGSTEGNVLETQTAQNVEIDGANHAKAVTFTMPNQSGTCGLQFKVPIMGMTVSARLVVDLNSATLVEEPATAAQENPAPQTPGTPTPGAQVTEPALAEIAPAAEGESVSETVPVSESPTASVSEEATIAEESTTGDLEMVDENGSTSTVWVIVGVAAAVVVIGGAAAFIVVKKKRG